MLKVILSHIFFAAIRENECVERSKKNDFLLRMLSREILTVFGFYATKQNAKRNARFHAKNGSLSLSKEFGFCHTSSYAFACLLNSEQTRRDFVKSFSMPYFFSKSSLHACA